MDSRIEITVCSFFFPTGEKKVRIEVGYGLEGVMTDAKSGYIIREVKLPYFRNGDYAGGLYEAVSTVSGIITQTSDISEEELAKYRKTQSSSSGSGGGIPIGFIVFIIFIILSTIGRGGRGGRRGRRGSPMVCSILGSVLGSSGRSHRGGSSGFGGGGGFGGFFRRWRRLRRRRSFRRLVELKGTD